MANDEKGRITVRIPEHLIKVLEDAVEQERYYEDLNYDPEF